MEKISALMDGELDGQEAGRQIQRLRQDEELTERWHTFHLIGDVMRDERPLSAGFVHRFASRISTEPAVLAPRRFAFPPRRRFTFALSAAASIAAVAVVGWVALSTAPPGPQPEMARATATAPATVAVSAPVPSLASVPSDGTMNEYLMAHQEFSPSTAIQGVAPYIRSVSTSRRTQGR